MLYRVVFSKEICHRIDIQSSYDFITSDISEISEKLTDKLKSSWIDDVNCWLFKKNADDSYILAVRFSTGKTNQKSIRCFVTVSAISLKQRIMEFFFGKKDE